MYTVQVGEIDKWVSKGIFREGSKNFFQLHKIVVIFSLDFLKIDMCYLNRMEHLLAKRQTRGLILGRIIPKTSEIGKIGAQHKGQHEDKAGKFADYGLGKGT